MSSQETLAGSSSRGTAIPLEATTGGHCNRPEDVDIALGEPTGGFILEVLEEICDPQGDYKVAVLGPQHDLPRLPVPDRASEIKNKIVSLFYDTEFHRLERVHECEDDFEDYYNTDDDGDDEDVEDVEDVRGDQVDGSSDEVQIREQIKTFPGKSKEYIYSCAPLNDKPQPGNVDISPTAPIVISVPKLAVSFMEPINSKLQKRAAVKDDGQGTGVPANLDQMSSPGCGE